MASSSNVGVARLPWNRLPNPLESTGNNGGGAMCSSDLEMSFRDIMAEQQRETSQEREFEEYIQKSYVTVGGLTQASSSAQEKKDQGTPTQETEDTSDGDLNNKVMSLFEEQDYDDIAYEMTEQELDQLADDECDKYYEGLAKKLSTVVELQNGSLSQSMRAKSGGSPLSSLSSQRTTAAGGSKGNKSASVLQTDSDSCFDPQSKVVLEKLLRKGVLRGGSSQALKVIHLGKCGTLFHATGGTLIRQEDTSPSTQTNGNLLKLRLPKECAVKVFMNPTSTPDKPESTEEEPRTKEAKREMSYLNRMTRAEIPCPHVHILVGHVLVTDFLGKDGVPAKSLKDANDLINSRANLKMAYQQITGNMKTLFKTCHLVLGDLSETNILWHKRQAYFMSAGGAVNSNRPVALELLYRDCVRITEFFNKKRKECQQTPEELFRWITDFDFTGQLQHEEITGGTCQEEGFAFI